MPPREAKGRYLTREYMADYDFQTKHTAEERELYLMLALFTDDAGWLDWDAGQLAFDVYRFADDRMERFKKGTAALERTGRLRVLKCGHAEMPKVSKRPRPGVQEHKIRDHHQSFCNRSRTIRGDPLPNLTKPKPNQHPTSPNVDSSITPRARAGSRARGGPPSTIGAEVGELKRKVGWGG